MPLFKKITDKNSILGIWHMTESLPELESCYTLKENEQKTYNEFRNDRRRKEWLTVRILLERLLGKKTEILYRDNGKPYLADNSMCISITHTIGYVAIRLATYPIAVDIEYKSKRVLNLIPRFVSQAETKYIAKEDEITSALLIWSAKETLFKLFDFSEILFDENLIVSDLQLSNSGMFKGTINKDEFSAIVKLKYELIDDLILVYC